MKTRHILPIIIVSALCLVGCGITQEDASSALDNNKSQNSDTNSDTDTTASQALITLPKEINYISLGDSISSGYALDDPNTQSYPALLTQALESDGHNVTYKNYATNGLTSSQLADKISQGDIEELSNADLITISIGANNILAPSQSFANSYLAYQAGTIDATQLYQEYKTFSKDAVTGVDNLSADLDTIITGIQAVNPDAIVMFLNVYNPYRNLDLSLTVAGIKLGVNTATDVMVTLVNDKLLNSCNNFDLTYVDIHEVFEASDANLLNASYDASTGVCNLDPHPNAVGHQVISDTIMTFIK